MAGKRIYLSRSLLPSLFIRTIDYYSEPDVELPRQKPSCEKTLARLSVTGIDTVVTSLADAMTESLRASQHSAVASPVRADA